MRTRWMRAAAAVMALALGCASVAGCGRGSTDANAGGGGSANAPKPTIGFDGKTIKVGFITAQTGPAKVIADPVTKGSIALFDRVNAAGGIAGKYKIEPVIVDSGFDATQAVQQYNAIKGKVAMIGQLLGTVITNAVLDQLKRDNMVALPGSLDSLWVREQNLLAFGAPYQVEAINGLDWYLRHGGRGKTICTAAQDDIYGEAAEAGAKFAAEKEGFRIAKQVRFKPTDKDFTAPVQGLKDAGCQGVLLASAPGGTAGLLAKAAGQGYAPQWIGLTSTWVTALGMSPLKDYLRQHLVVVGDGAAWGDTSVPGMKQMMADWRSYAPKTAPDPYFISGYTEGQAVVQLLEQAVRRGDLSRQGLIDAMNSLDKLTFDGLMGDYGYGPPEQRDPARVNTIFGVDPKAPTGLVVREAGVQSAAAEQFEFSS